MKLACVMRPMVRRNLKVRSPRTTDEDVVKMVRYSNEMLLKIYQTKLESFQLKSGEMAGVEK